MYRSYSFIRRLYSIALSCIATRWSCVVDACAVCCMCSVTDLNTITYTLFLVIFQNVRAYFSTYLFTSSATLTPDAIHRQTTKLNLSEFHYFLNWIKSVAILLRSTPVYFVINSLSFLAVFFFFVREKRFLPASRMQVLLFLCLVTVGFVAAQSGPKITDTVCKKIPYFLPILFLEFHIVCTCPKASNRNER